MMCEKKKFGIFLDNVLEYLEIKQKIKFYEKFRNKYVENLDYIKVHVSNRKIKNKRCVKYYITLDTFGNICMRSKADKAENVRDYFTILGKFINYYKDNISEMIEREALKNPEGYIYILLLNKNKKLFKIGKTFDIRKRLRTYATGYATHPDIKFILLVKDRDVIENCVKVLMGQYQYKPNKEVYKVDIDTIKNAIFDCASLNVKYDAMLNDKKVDSYVIFDDNINDMNIDELIDKKQKQDKSSKSTKSTKYRKSTGSRKSIRSRKSRKSTKTRRSKNRSR